MRQSVAVKEELARQRREAEDTIKLESERIYQEQEQFWYDMAKRTPELNHHQYEYAGEILGCEHGAL